MFLTRDTTLQNNKYRIDHILGQGGFGITYQGRQTGLDRLVAIKEFFLKDACERKEGQTWVSMSQGNWERTKKFRQKFLKEAQMIAKLRHPRIIRIIDVFEENNTAYYVMEYQCNGSLKGLVELNGPLPEEVSLGYIRQIADALDYIHRRQMLHLDIKPDNVMLDEESNAVVIDFGLSKRYDDQGQAISETPLGVSRGYTPIEQYKAGGIRNFSPCADIYALGATFYFLLTGQRPPEALELINSSLPPLPEGISKQTVEAILRAMRPLQKERPQTIAEFLKLLPKDQPQSGNHKNGSWKKEKAPKEEARKRQDDEEINLEYKYDSKSNKYGYVDKITGKLVIPHKFQLAHEFKDGLAKVMLNEKWGAINKRGEFAIPCQYDEMREFQDGVALVGLFGIESYVKWNGQVMNPNPDNRATFRCHPDGSVQHNLVWGLIDREGCPLTRFQYDQVYDFKGGLARVAKAGKWGYIDNRGKQVIDCQYQKAEDFHNGKAVVTTFDGWQYMINKKGECTLNAGETLKL